MSLEKGDRILIVGGDVRKEFGRPMEGEIIAVDGKELLVNVLEIHARYICRPNDVLPIGKEEREAYGILTRRFNPQHIPRELDRVQEAVRQREQRVLRPQTRREDDDDNRPYVIEPYWDPRDPGQIFVEMPTNRGRRGQWYYTEDLNPPEKDEDEDNYDEEEDDLI